MDKRVLSTPGILLVMNRHFKDSWYYLKRAGETGRKGVTETLSPVKRTVREYLGREREPKPSRSDRFEMKLESLQRSSERTIRTAIGRARKRVEEYREQWAA